MNAHFRPSSDRIRFFFFPQLFPIYRTAGPSPELIVPAAVLFLISICGVALNSFVIYVTIKTRAFRGTANFLMALICALEVLHQSGHTLFFVVTITGINFISNRTSDLFLMPAILASNANMTAMFGAAADRLFAVVAPFWHKRVDSLYKSVYLGAHCFVTALFSLFSLYSVLAFDFSHLEMPTSGIISEVYPSLGPRKEIGIKFLAFTTLLNIACIVCYAFIWLHIKCKNGVSKETNTRLLRSLATILLISVGGYLINLIMYVLIYQYGPMFGIGPLRVWQMASIPGILLNIGAASNAPILYKNSTEYRIAFKKELNALAKFFCRSNDHLRTLPRAVGSAKVSARVEFVTMSSAKQSIAIKRY